MGSESHLQKEHLLHLAVGLGRDLLRDSRPLLAYNLIFAVLAMTVFAPLLTWAVSAMASLGGRLTIGNDEVLSFLLSVRGYLFLVVSISLVVLIVFVEYAGMMLIAWAGRTGRRLTAAAALWSVVQRARHLAVLGLGHVAVHLLIVLPLAGLAVAAYQLFVPFTPYFLVMERPPEAWTALVIAGSFCVAVIVFNGPLYLLWFFALPCLLLEGLTPREAARRSRCLVKTARGRVIFTALICVGFTVLLPVGMAYLFESLGGAIFAVLPGTLTWTLTGGLVAAALFLVLSFAGEFLIVALNCLVIIHAYADLTGAGSPEHSTPSLSTTASGEYRNRLMIPLAALTLAGVIALTGAALVMVNIDLHDTVAITAHRGSSLAAPENTLSAIARAIEDGADCVEIDVQQTADGAVVLLHDEDLVRVAGLNRKIWELRYDQLRDLDVGSWFSPEFKDERIPLLSEAIALARNRIDLHIELKATGRVQQLAKQVAEIISQTQCADQCIVSSFDRAALELIRRRIPGVQVGYIVSHAIGKVERLDVDFLSVSSQFAQPALIARAHRAGKEVHVWTINKPRQMVRFIDLGADSLITDDPAVARRLLNHRAAMSDEELLLLKIRSWFIYRQEGLAITRSITP